MIVKHWQNTKTITIHVRIFVCASSFSWSRWRRIWLSLPRIMIYFSIFASHNSFFVIKINVYEFLLLKYIFVPCTILDLFFKVCLFFWNLRIPFQVLIFNTITVIQGMISMKTSSDKNTYNIMYHSLFLKLVVLVWYGSHNMIFSFSKPSNVNVSFVPLKNNWIEELLFSIVRLFVDATFMIIVL